MKTKTQFFVCATITAIIYIAAWANANPAIFIKRGIHPIGTQAVYIAGEVCTINLEKDNYKKSCAINMPLYISSHQLISTLNECLNKNNMTVDTVPEWVAPAHQQCLRLHDQWRRKGGGND